MVLIISFVAVYMNYLQCILHSDKNTHFVSLHKPLTSPNLAITEKPARSHVCKIFAIEV